MLERDDKEKNRWLDALAIISLVFARLLMGINIYGMTQPIRKPGLGVTDHDKLRFSRDQLWSYEDSAGAINAPDASLPRSELASAANQENPEAAKEKYLATGFSEKDSETLRKVYQTGYFVFYETFHFMGKRYLFKIVSYWLKWLMAALLILVSTVYLVRRSATKGLSKDPTYDN